MQANHLLRFAAAFVCIGLVPTSTVRPPDEGMWTFDNLPLQLLKDKYQFEPSKQWIEHVRLGSVRFDTGGSGSFVSPNGLVMTNHHVALATLQGISTPEKDWVKDGFSAKQYGSEPHGDDLTLRQLVEMRDVTAEVQAAEAEGENEKARDDKRRDKLMQLANAASDAEKHLKADPVTFYDGRQFYIYVYHIYDDVRVVFAPEKQVAFFGGDYDNFTYPRYDLDCAFFRVYEDGKPVDSSKWFFKWNADGAKTDELVFVSGHPGGTERLLTYDEMVFHRDVSVPGIVRHLTRMRDLLQERMQKSAQQAFALRDTYFGVANSLKAYEGHLAGLRDAPMLEKIKARDEALMAKSGKPEVQQAFEFIAEQMQKLKEKFAGERVNVQQMMAEQGRVMGKVCADAKATINKARFDVYGTSMYPDATFTLRLAFGTVKGYEAGTTLVPPKTTFNGLYERNVAFENQAPWDLPKNWLEAKDKLKLDTPLNFVSTVDIIGGNSGSPILNRDAQVVGLVFDGNIESLPGNYWFDEKVNRCVGVHSGGMLEAIAKVYGEIDLVKELRDGK